MVPFQHKHTRSKACSQHYTPAYYENAGFKGEKAEVWIGAQWNSSQRLRLGSLVQVRDALLAALCGRTVPVNSLLHLTSVTARSRDTGTWAAFLG